MREAARGYAWTRALGGLAGVVALIVTMIAVLPAVSDARLPDSDGDGVADRVESRRLHTNPHKVDTDRDKLGDGVEAHVTRTNPRRMDTDHDGLTDGFEVKRSKTKPRRFDTDGDRTGDGLELLLGRNPRVRDGKVKALTPVTEPALPEAPLSLLPDPLPDPPPLPDLLPPDTSISSGPSGTVTTRSASFGFTSSETGSAFECRLDAGAWASCASPKAYSGLANASHTFSVRATDPAGNTDLTPASRTWTVNVPPPDTTAPDTTINSGPSGTVTSSSASFGFTSSETGSTFECRLDAGAWASCASPKAYSGLANGSHTFDVRATDAAGNTDATPASRTWLVNVTQSPPGVITVQPGGNITAAYNQAQSGDVIELGCGSYGDWDTPEGGTKTVTVRAATRNCAKFSRLHAHSSNITLDGLDIDAGGGAPSCGGSECAAFEAWGGETNITFKNGRIGNVGGQKGAFLHGSSDTSSQGVVIENTEIHDVRITAEGQHLECVMSHSPGVVFRGNTFRNCGVFDISLGRGDWWGQPEYGNVTIENNLFGHTVDGGAGGNWHYFGLAWWLTTLDGARVVNNTFENAVSMDRATRGTGGVWANNIGGGWTCEPGVVYTGNVGQTCSAQDKAVNPSSSTPSQTAPMGWVNPGAFNFHLTAGSPAINAGSAQYAPATDREGKPRTGAPDAGAYEF